MQKNKRIFLVDKSIFFVVILGTYIILGLYLLEYFQYQISFDGTAVISISKTFKAGDIYSGINAYWGLLYPLLLTPFLFIPSPHLMFSVKLYQLLTGLVGMFSFFYFLKLFYLSSLIKAWVKVLSIPIFLYFVYYTISVDLLFLTLLLLYLSIIFSPTYGSRVRDGFLIGLVGGLLFLTKEYALYYFLAHFILFSIFHLISTKAPYLKKNIVKQFIVGVMIFAIFVGVWSAILYTKYHRVMIGVRGEVNIGLINPKFQQYPMFDKGLFKLPNPHGLTIWDDPTYLPLESWNPLGKYENIQYLTKRFWENTKLYLGFLNNFSVFSISVLLVGLTITFLKFKELLLKKDPMFFSMITIFTFPLGYLPLLVEKRYIWVIYVLTLLVAAYLVSRILALKFFLKRKFLYLISFTVAMFFLISFAIPSIKYLKNYHYIDHTYFDQGKILKNMGITGSKIATNSDYHHSAYMLFYSSNQYLGIPRRTDKFSDFEQQLLDADADYFLIWNTNKYIENFRSKYRELDSPFIGNLYFFDLNQIK